MCGCSFGIERRKMMGRTKTATATTKKRMMMPPLMIAMAMAMMTLLVVPAVRARPAKPDTPG